MTRSHDGVRLPTGNTSRAGTPKPPRGGSGISRPGYARGGSIVGPDTWRIVGDVNPGCPILPMTDNERERIRSALAQRGIPVLVRPEREPHTHRGRLARTLRRIAHRLDPA